MATPRAKTQHQFDWDDLHTLIAVARAGSLAGAATELGTHRSTVLRRIERLEARLGIRVFDRTPQGLALTAAGERVAPYVERMAGEVDEVLQSADADHERPAGKIRLAATFNLGFGLLPRAIGRFRSAYPEITVEVMGTLDGYSTIHPDQFDIALRTLEGDVADHEQMVGRRLGKLPLAIYGGKSYFTDKPIPRSLKGLHQHKLLLGCGGLSNLSALRWLERSLKSNIIVYRASSMLLLLAAVREGLGLSCLPCYLCERDSRIVRAFDVPKEHCADLWVLRHAHSRDSARLRVFSEFLASNLQQYLFSTQPKA
jgi:DNA-binding transcriptional LysR family regulator